MATAPCRAVALGPGPLPAARLAASFSPTPAIWGEKAKRTVAKKMSHGTNARNTDGSVASSKTPPAVPPKADAIIKGSRRRATARSSVRYARVDAICPGNTDIALVAFAVMGGSPAAIRAENVKIVPPPARALTVPAAKPAPRSKMSVEKSKMSFSFGGLKKPIAGLGLAGKPKNDPGRTEDLETLYQGDPEHTTLRMTDRLLLCLLTATSTVSSSAVAKALRRQITAASPNDWF